MKIIVGKKKKKKKNSDCKKLYRDTYRGKSIAIYRCIDKSCHPWCWWLRTQCIVVRVPQGPVFAKPLAGPDDIERLDAGVDVRQALGYVMDAITLTRHKLDGRCPLFGFSGAPVSTATCRSPITDHRSESCRKRTIVLRPVFAPGL